MPMYANVSEDAHGFGRFEPKCLVLRIRLPETWHSLGCLSGAPMRFRVSDTNHPGPSALGISGFIV